MIWRIVFKPVYPPPVRSIQSRPNSATDVRSHTSENEMLRESLSLEDWDLLQSLIQENRPEDHMAVSQVAHIPSATYAGTPSTVVVPGPGVDFHPPAASSSSVFDPASSTLTTTSEIE